MIINSIYTKYFQKSKIFLYPLLGIKKGVSIVPDSTYIMWEGNYTSDDMKLICTYTNRTDKEFTDFEQNVLLKHNRLHDYVRATAEISIFVFDFSDEAADWNNLINGKYSRISIINKDTILNFFEKFSGNYIYIYGYLYPDNWFSRYAELLDVNESLLKDVGELCNKPDLDKENLVLVVTDLERIKILD